MTVNDYHRAAMRTAPELDRQQMLIDAALGLTGEAGEVADLVKKANYQGHILDKDAIMKELGDVAWYIALACQGLGVTMQEVFQMNVDKLKKRYPDGFDAWMSRNRTE
ncbi:MAG: nucleoside triphosphate pyrophosphohydrolase family protein [Christensenellales bacterium]|jgi:NTP pyrophosphatase (non-canonical NTP hydrolase)|nr:MAG TPA: NTP-PPase-like protein [Caudoviricetes sp.]